jgi:hypothetical protein
MSSLASLDIRSVQRPIPIEPLRDSDELVSLLQHPVWNALRSVTVSSVPSDAEIAVYQSLLRLARFVQADVHEWAEETRRNLEEAEDRRNFEHLEPESRWERIQRMHELTQSLGLDQTNLAPAGTDTVEPIRESPDDLFSESAVRQEVSIRLLSESAVQRLVASRPFQCPVCFEAVSNPVVFMPCGHFLCRMCFEGMERVARKSVRRLSCHLCRQRLGLYTLWELVCAELEDGKNGETADGRGDEEREGDGIVVEKGFQGFIRRIRDWTAQVCGWFGR